MAYSDDCAHIEAMVDEHGFPALVAALGTIAFYYAEETEDKRLPWKTLANLLMTIEQICTVYAKHN